MVVARTIWRNRLTTAWVTGGLAYGVIILSRMGR